MTVSAFGVEDGRISKATKEQRKYQQRRTAVETAATGALGTAAGVAAGRSQRVDAKHWKGEANKFREMAKPGPVEASHKLRAARGAAIAEATGKAKSLRRISNKRVAIGAGIGTALGAMGGSTSNVGKSAFDIEDSRVSKADKASDYEKARRRLNTSVATGGTAVGLGIGAHRAHQTARHVIDPAAAKKLTRISRGGALGAAALGATAVAAYPKHKK